MQIEVTKVRTYWTNIHDEVVQVEATSKDLLTQGYQRLIRQGRQVYYRDGSWFGVNEATVRALSRRPTVARTARPKGLVYAAIHLHAGEADLLAFLGEIEGARRCM